MHQLLAPETERGCTILEYTHRITRTTHKKKSEVIAETDSIGYPAVIVSFLDTPSFVQSPAGEPPQITFSFWRYLARVSEL